MSTVWDRFEGITNPEEVLEAKTQFTPIEAGNYVARLEKLEPSESKSGLPMLKGQFRTEQNKVIFYNQMLQNISMPSMTAVNIAEALTFINAITGEDLEFTGLGELAERVTNVSLGVAYNIIVSYGKNDTEKNFPKIKVLGKTEDLPF